MTKLLIIGLGGFLGAVLRYLLSGWVYDRIDTGFPLGTLVVNLSGSFFLGLTLGIVEQHILPPHLALFLTIGVLGAFTTFSTLSFETWALIEIGSLGKATLNIIASVGLGLMAVIAGLLAGRAI